MKVCLIGGGNLSHAIISSANYKYLSLLTNKKEYFDNKIIGYCNSSKTEGFIHLVTDDTKKALKNIDIVIITTPSFMYKEVLTNISPYVTSNMWIGSIQATGGFDWIAKNILPNHNNVFGLQRVPYICRVIEYGKSVEFSQRDILKFAVPHGCIKSNDIQLKIHSIFNCKVMPLDSFLDITLLNSNPLLHPARLYAIFNNISQYTKNSFFYANWDNYSSKILIECDNELQNILQALPMEFNNIVPILQYYESNSIEELTKKIISIKSWSNIKIEFDLTSLELVPDKNSRYFTEDISFGLLIIKNIAEIVNIETPYIDKVICWAQIIINKDYVNNGKLNGRDIVDTGIPANYNIHTVNKLLYRRND